MTGALCQCGHVPAVHKDGVGTCSITDCTCAKYVAAPPAELLGHYGVEAIRSLGTIMDSNDNPLVLQGLANFANYLWFRLQQRNAKALNTEPEMARAEKNHEAECARYKALLPKEWQW